METIDMKKLETAILYLQRIADGNNPVNNMPVKEDSVINNPNVIRCMYFIKEVLEEVRRNGGYIGRTQKKSDLPDFPLDVLDGFVYKEDKPITRVVEQINELIDTAVYRKLSYRPVTQYLKQNGYLEEVNTESGKNVTGVTEMGNAMGIYSEKRISMRGQEYMAILYGKKAQEFIVSHMAEIIAGESL